MKTKPLILFILFISLWNQEVHSQKMVNELSLEQKYRHVYPFNTDQLIVVTENEGKVTNVHTIQLYDSSLKLVKEVTIKGASLYYQEIYFTAENTIYIRVTSYLGKSGTQFYRYDSRLKLLSVTDADIGTCFSTSYFQELSDSEIVVSGLQCKSSDHFTTKINLKTGKPTYLAPAEFSEGKRYPYHNRLLDVKILKDDKTIVAIYNDYDDRSDTTYINFRNDVKSEYGREILLLGPGKRIYRAEIEEMNGKLLFYGTYMDDSLKDKNKYGLFMCEYDRKKIIKTNIFPLYKMNLSGTQKTEMVGNIEFREKIRDKLDSTRKDWISRHDTTEMFPSALRLFQAKNGYTFTSDLGDDCTDGFLVLGIDEEFNQKFQKVFPVLIGSENENHYYNDGSSGMTGESFYYGYIYNGYSVGFSLDSKLNHYPFTIQPETERSMENSHVSNAHVEYWYDSYFLIIYNSYFFNPENSKTEDEKFIIRKMKLD